MKTKNYSLQLILSLLLVFTLSIGYSQSKNSIWQETSQNNLLEKSVDLVIRKSEPLKAKFYEIELSSLKQSLIDAPIRNNSNSTSSDFIIDFPLADGTFEAFKVMESSILAPELQAIMPNSKSYVGQSITNPSNSIRFSITGQGLHAMLFTTSGTQFIDPYTKNGNSYLVYFKKNLPLLETSFLCETPDSDLIIDRNNLGFDLDAARNANDGILRTYRIAIATTIEYSQFHWLAAGLNAGDTETAKKQAVLDAIIVSLTRITGVYEKELSVRLELVSNNLSIIFINSDSFSNTNTGALINQSQSVIDAIIGNSNYDIGHTFSTGAGGLAQLAGAPCNTGSKARGVTGTQTPVGDGYDIDFVAHEIGHQFGAPHTFNGNAGNCAGGNRTASNAYEPGSGTTIMAYAGICPPQNVQNNSDDYFHQKSLQMMWANISTSNCGQENATGNSAPSANAGGDFIIPISTPYKLTGSSTDSNGTDSHTYTWEQYDLGPAGVPTITTTSGPMVRSFKGTENPVRYIPTLPDVVSNGGQSTTWEKLAAVGRLHTFRLTVRDNDLNGGQTATDAMTATTTTNAGPFVVTSQNTSNISWNQGSTQTVTWSVAGTNANGVNAANVNILLSTDGGATFGTTLASNVSNDGSHDITVPNITASFCRIMVEASNNIFFNVNLENFAIGTTVTTSCTTYASAENLGLAVPDGAGTTGPVQGTPLFHSINIPDDVTIDEIKVSADISHADGGEYLIQIQHPDVATNDAFVNVWVGSCPGNSDIDLTFDDSAGAIVCASPTTGTFAAAASLGDTFNGLNAQGDWNIVVVDFFVGNTGTLNDWSIEICSTQLSVDEFEFDNLNIFPNPNNGEFTVNFNSNSGKDIAIEVYDIRGRSVMAKSYNNIGIFNETITLGNVQSGMYLLNIKDGDRKVTRKIIVD